MIAASTPTEGELAGPTTATTTISIQLRTTHTGSHDSVAVLNTWSTSRARTYTPVTGAPCIPGPTRPGRKASQKTHRI